METPKSIAFAYFVNGEFVGWYADTFGSVRDCPKLYRYKEKQLEVIRNNFQKKMKRINEETFEEARAKVKGLQAISLAVFDSAELLAGKGRVELRIVETPFYEGPNPDFHEETYEKELAEWTNAGCPGNFWEDYSSQPKETWIYADMSNVKMWAKQAPTEFKETLWVYELGKNGTRSEEPVSGGDGGGK